MSMEWTILLGVWIFVVMSLIRWVPVSKIPDACVLFLSAQFVTWAVGLFIVEMGWIEYPFRILEKNRTSITFEYSLFPILNIFFNLYYPENQSKAMKLMHYLWLTGSITLYETWLERYTRFIFYTGWTSYWTFLTIAVGFYLFRKYYLWFAIKPYQTES